MIRTEDIDESEHEAPKRLTPRPFEKLLADLKESLKKGEEDAPNNDPQCPRCGMRCHVQYGRRSKHFTVWHPNTDCPISWQDRIWMPTEQEAIAEFLEAWQ
jgi:hypothetical protein